MKGVEEMDLVETSTLNEKLTELVQKIRRDAYRQGFADCIVIGLAAEDVGQDEFLRTVDAAIKVLGKPTIEEAIERARYFAAL
jgi:hypothetical protein